MEAFSNGFKRNILREFLPNRPKPSDQKLQRSSSKSPKQKMNFDSDLCNNRTVDFILFSFYVDDIRICRAKVVASNSVKDNSVTNNNNTDKKQ